MFVLQAGFSNNEALTEGGAIFLSSGSLTATNATFSGNKAGSGGALLATDDPTLVLDQVGCGAFLHEIGHSICQQASYQGVISVHTTQQPVTQFCFVMIATLQLADVQLGQSVRAEHFNLRVAGGQ